MANNTGKRLKTFLKIRIKHDKKCQPLPLPFNFVMKIQAKLVRQANQIKPNQNKIIIKRTKNTPEMKGL